MGEDTAVEWHRAARADELEEGEPKLVAAGKFQIALCKVAGRCYAIDDICTHEYASLCDGVVEGDAIECPLHQAKFHIPTGKVLTPPAADDLKTYAVKVENGEVLIGLPKG